MGLSGSEEARRYLASSRSIFQFILRGGGGGPSVCATLSRYWRWTPEDDVRPLIFLMSE